MNTNKKVFKEQVQAYIIQSMNHENVHEKDIREQLQCTVKDFYSYYVRGNIQSEFISFMQGLPTGFNIDYTYHNISEVVKGWFENCGETYVQKDNETDFFYKIIYREFSKLCREYNVTL